MFYYNVNKHSVSITLNAHVHVSLYNSFYARRGCMYLLMVCVLCNELRIGGIRSTHDYCSIAIGFSFFFPDHSSIHPTSLNMHTCVYVSRCVDDAVEAHSGVDADEQYTSINQPRAGRFDLNVFFSCLKVEKCYERSLFSMCWHVFSIFFICMHVCI